MASTAGTSRRTHVKRRTTCTDVWEKGLSPSLVPALRSHSPNSNRPHRSRQNRTTVEGGEKTAETSVRGPAEVEAVVTNIGRGGGAALLVMSDTSMAVYRDAIRSVAERYHLPTITDTASS
jgi:hypothetical protein